MRLSSILNLGLIALGAAASIKTLKRRHAWEKSNQCTAIVLDYDDALSVSTRSGLPLGEFLRSAHDHGATHLSLPELTLDRLMRTGRLVLTIPHHPLTAPPPNRGESWRYLAGTEPDLMEHLVTELRARVPAAHAQFVPHAQRPTIALAGHLPTLAEMGLG
ncbi:MAG: hypothetical protein ACRDH2_15775, partial [Anaerolineales bacterium]